MVVYPAPATGPQSRGIVHRQPAMNKLAPNNYNNNKPPTPKHNPTLTLP